MFYGEAMSFGEATPPQANSKRRIIDFSRAVTSRAAIPLAALFFFVILSEAFVRDERTNTQAKDPYPHNDISLPTFPTSPAPA